LHASSRLDAEVSGVVIFARTDKAIKALLAARRAGRYRRLYVGLTQKAPEAQRGQWTFPVGLDPQNPKRRVTGTGKLRGKKEARTDYEVASTLEVGALLRLRPWTGRTHQLRVHCQEGGCPLLGDSLYGGNPRVVLPDGRVVTARRTMLHCALVQVPRVDAGGDHVFTSPAPPELRRVWQDLGGDEAVFEGVCE